MNDHIILEHEYFLDVRHFNGAVRTVDGISILYVNINRMMNKIELLEEFLCSKKLKVDIIILTETFLTSSESKFINFSEYRGFHLARPNRPGGGVSVFAKNELLFEVMHSESYLENDIVVIHSKLLKLSVIGIYRPGHTNLNIFFDYFNGILEKYHQSIIVGDFNINLFQKENQNVVNYKSIISMNGFNIVNNISPEYYTRKTDTASLLDHLITDLNQKMFILLDDVYLSDHKFILVKLLKGKPSRKETQIETVDEQAVIYSISQLNIDSIDFDSFHKILQDIVIANTHTKLISSKNSTFQKPWFNKQLKELIKHRDKFYKLHKIYSGNIYFKEVFSFYKSLVRKKVLELKQDYYSNAFLTNNSKQKKMWSLIREVLTNKPQNENNVTPAIEILKDNILITDKKLVVCELNKHFTTINNFLTKNICTNRPNYVFVKIPMINNMSSFEPTDQIEILELIKNLDTTSARGYDKVSVKMVKQLQDKLSLPLTNWINLALVNGLFPNSLKIARITPIFKTGLKTCASNYRPISVLPIISKLFERVIYNRLLKHLRVNNLINKNQYGFLPNSSTLSATLNLTEKLYTSIERKSRTAVLFIDLQKAFDCVNFEILIEKLIGAGIGGECLTLIQNYLKNRQQYVKYKSDISSLLNITAGVPQGSILGPIFFLIYVNDLFDVNFNGQLQMFADDAALVYSCKSYDEMKFQLETDLQTLKYYLDQNKLLLNVHKTSFIIFQSNKIDDNVFKEISFNGEVIKRVENICYLGLHLNYKLNFVNHINNIQHKITPFVAVLKRVGKYLNEQAAFAVYFSHILSHVIYLIGIWGSTSPSNILSLQILQNNAVKCIKRLNKFTPTYLLYSDNVLPIKQLIDYTFLVTIFKIKTGLIKINYVTTNNLTITNRNTRNALHCRLPNYKLRVSQNSLFYRGQKLFNSLPNEAKQGSIGLFKNYIKKVLFQQFIAEYSSNHIL